MKLAVIAPLYYTIPPKTYGGTEAVVYNLVEGLVKNGHDVTLFACKGSTSSAKIYPKWNKKLDIVKDGAEDKKYQYDRIKHIISISKEFDLIHNNDGILPILNEKKFSCPLITTWHSPFSQYILDYPEEVEITVLARIVDIITDIPGVKYTNNGGSITVPEGSKVVKITEVYPTVDIQKAFERPIQQ